MTKFVCDGFRPIRKNTQIGYTIVQSCSDAASIFADRLARRSGKSYRATVNINSWSADGKSAQYQATIFATSGAFEYVWLHVSEVD